MAAPETRDPPAAPVKNRGRLRVYLGTAPGSVHEKRWQDVQQLLDAGIEVITTVNIQHLESLNDVVAAITGIKQVETVPDEVVRAAEQIELVDMTPQALRRRMAHGHIYPAERIDTALGNYFREGNLTALRELALLWVADRVEEGLDRYRAQHGIKGTWAARDRIVVALTGNAEGKVLLRRGARIAGRVAGRTLIAVHVVRSDATVGTSATEIERQRLLAENRGEQPLPFDLCRGGADGGVRSDHVHGDQCPSGDAAGDPSAAPEQHFAFRVAGERHDYPVAGGPRSFDAVLRAVPVSYTHLTLPTKR